MKVQMRVRVAAITAALSTVAVAARPVAAQVRQAGQPALSGQLADVRTALDKYRDPVMAVRDGFLSTVGCIDFSRDVKDGPVLYKKGTMGVHFLNMANVGPTPDPAKPQVLIYEPHGEKLELVAAEWFVPAELVKDSVAPKIFDQALQGPMPGHEPIIPAALVHYDLHVWLWRNNPKGMFEPTNSAVKCPKGGAYTYDLSAHHHDME